MKISALILIICFPFLVLSQQVDLIVQSGHTGNINMLCYSSDGKLLASYGLDKKVIVWNILQGKQMCTLQLDSTDINGMYFDNKDKNLIICRSHGYFSWDIGTSIIQRNVEPLTQVVTPYSLQIKFSSLYNSEGNFRIYSERNKIIRRNADNKIVFKRSCEYFDDRFNAIDASEKNNLVLGANTDGKIYLYQLEDGKKVRSASGKNIPYLVKHNSDVNDIRFSPDESNFASASSDRSVIIWNTNNLKEEKRLAAMSFCNHSVAFDITGRYLIVGNELGDIKTIDLSSTDLSSETVKQHKQSVCNVIPGIDAATLISAGYDNRIIIRNSEETRVVAETNSLYRKFRNLIYEGVFGMYPLQPPFTVSALGVNNSATLIATGYDNNSISIHRGDKRWKKTICHHAHPIRDISFISDSVFVSFDGTDSICYWLVNNKNKVFQSNQKLSFSATGSTSCINGSGVLYNSQMVYLYNFETNELIDFYPIRAVAAECDVKHHFLAVATSKNEITVFDISTQRLLPISVCKGHTAAIKSLSFHPERPLLASTGDDASVKLWNIETGQLIVSIIPIGKNDKIAVTPDNYYLTSKNNLNAIGFKVGYDLYSADQFDIQFNRPDIVLERLGYVDEKTIELYRKAYEKRLNKIGFSEEMFSPDWHTPEVEITNLSAIPFSVSNDSITLNIKAWDTKCSVDRINIWVNDVPLYGRNGMSYKSTNHNDSISISLPVQLSFGKNKIQVSCINSNAAESRKENLIVEYIPPVLVKPNLYFIVVSVSDYHDPSINLKYAVKDGHDLVNLFTGNKSITRNFDKIIIDTLFDERATRDNFFAIKEKILNTRPDDKVIVFFSGHGLLNENQDFYYATSDIAFDKPEIRGIAFDEIENFLDSIPARHKLLMVDACHSGEVDKEAQPDDPFLVIAPADSNDNQLAQNTKLTEYSYRSIEYNPSSSGVGIYSSFDIMKDMFAGLDKGTGTMVLAAAAGTGLAIESNEWKNGVFTYTILRGLKNKQADLNNDGLITVSEIKDYSIKEVETLTRGKQKPTARKENTEFDWRLR